jgi:hypothetical protein
MSEGSNKRVVKKTKVNKMNIKVSTEDNGEPLGKDLNKDNTKSNSKGKYSVQNGIPETTLTRLLEDNQNLEIELENIKEELQSEKNKTISDLESLNKELEVLNKTQNNVCTKNKSILNKLKEIQKDIDVKFTEKFKLSKVIENKRSNLYNKNINIEIKSKENEQNNVQKDIKINQKEIERLQKILDENKENEGSKVEENYKVVKENMENLQKEINDLNQIKLEHKNCTKNINILKNKLNVLFIDMEFERKRLIMFSTAQPKKEKNGLNENTKRSDYGIKVRNNVLQNTKNKYDFKDVELVNKKSYDFLKNEMIETERKIRKDLEEEKIENNKGKDSLKVYLFTEAEKEVFQKIMPNELFNNLNDKFNEKEVEMKKIEETLKEQKDQKRKLYLDNLKYEEINLKKQELRMKKTNLMSENIKNNKKIIEMKNIIKKKQKEIDNENRKIARFTEKNSTMNAILKKYMAERKKEKEKEQKEMTKTIFKCYLHYF